MQIIQPRLAVTLFGLSIAVLGGCGPRDQQPAANGSTATPAVGSAALAPNVVTVHARDYAFDAPDTIPGGVTTFRLINDGPGLHHMVLVRLDSAKTLPDLLDVFQHHAPLPQWAVVVGGPNAPDPHTEANATLDLTPGSYALLCFVDVPGGVPHVSKGMSRTLTVGPAATPAAPLPVSDVTVTMSDYKFGLSGPITAGHHTFLVQTLPGQDHELEVVRLAPGKTAQDMLAWLQKMQGPPPGQAIGGAADVAPARPFYFSADFTPGTYVFMCFLPDATDGKPHIAHGMVQTISVT